MPDPVQLAKKDLDRIIQVIRRAEETIQQATAEYEQIKAFLKMYDRYAKGEGLIDIPKGRNGTSRRALVAKAADIHIRAVGQPVPKRDLLVVLKQQNVKIGGKDEKTRLAAILSAHPNFEYVEGKGWWIKGLEQKKGPDGPNPSGPTLNFSGAAG